MSAVGGPVRARDGDGVGPGSPMALGPGALLVVGELLVEVMRPAGGGPLDRPGVLLGPFASGAPAIVASVAARLGVPVALVGTVGADAFGRLLRTRLAGDGVDVTGVREAPGLATGCAFVAYDPTGGREFVFHATRSAAADVAGDMLGDRPERARWVHVSGSTAMLADDLGRLALTAARRARAAGARVSVDPNTRPGASAASRETVHALLETADVVTPAEGELAALGYDAGDLAARGVLVCETRGALGARLATAGGWVDVPAPERVEVDPTGAGDHFAAALVAGLLRGRSPLDAVRAAVRVAADSVTVQGPMEAPVRSGDA